MDYNNFALGEMSLSMFMYEVFTPKFLPLSAQVRGMIWHYSSIIDIALFRKLKLFPGKIMSCLRFLGSCDQAEGISQFSIIRTTSFSFLSPIQ